MSTRNRILGREMIARASVFVVVSTVALTASFLGVVGLFTGRVGGLTARLPFYMLVMAVCFVVTIVAFESLLTDPQQILLFAALASVGSLVLVTLGGEGIVYLFRYTEQVVTSHLLFSILAAGLIGTGLSYWAVQHSTELAETTARL